MSSFSIASLLEKLTNADSDIRFMAMNDISIELSRDGFSIEEAAEKKVVTAVLKALDDKNGEVQNLAVKTLVPLIKRIRESQIKEVVDALCNLLTDGRPELKDIASIGLKTVVTELPQQSAVAKNTVKRVLPKLVSLLQPSGEVQLDVIDILAESLSRFGSVLLEGPLDLARQTQTVLLGLLNHQRLAIRKRSIAAIGALVVYTSEELFEELVASIVKSLQEKANARDYDKLRTYIATVGTLSRFNARRIGKHINTFMQLIFTFIAIDDDELRENCFQTLEMFIVRCPSEVAGSLNNIVKASLEYLKHDPNYNDDDEEEMEIDGDDDDDNEDMEDKQEDEDDDDEYDDDEDMSWKVRRSSAKLLASIIGTRGELLGDLLKDVSPVLITRFKEREESVRVEVLSTFTALIRQVGASSGTLTTGTKENWRNASNASLASDPRSLLQDQVPRICKNLAKQLNSKSALTRQAGFTLLKELATVLEGGLNDHIAWLVPSVESSLSNAKEFAGNANLKIEVLQCIQVLLAEHEANAFQAHFNKLVPAVLAAVGEKFYKITSEALSATIELIKVIRPIPADAVSVAPASTNSRSAITRIFPVVLKSVQVTDVDLEVKERSIKALGTIISMAGDLLDQTDLSSGLALLVERLKSEVTRVIGLKALKAIASSVLVHEGSFSLIEISNEVVDLSVSFLKKAERQLRLASLGALEQFVAHAGEKLTSTRIVVIVAEIADLISNDADMVTLPAAVSVVAVALHVEASRSEVLKCIHSGLIPSVIRLTLESPHLVSGGVGSEAITKFWRAAIAADASIYSGCVSSFVDPFLKGVSVSKQAYAPVAHSMACLLDVDQGASFQSFAAALSPSNANVALLHLSLLVVANVGRSRDLSQAFPQLHTSLIVLFDSPSEEVKHAAAFALGSISLGNLNYYLPLVIAQVREGGKKRNLVFVALKEVIAGSTSLSHANELWELLFANATDAQMEESTRTTLAECLGKLCILDPRTRLQALKEQLSSSSSSVRAIVVSAVRNTLTDTSADAEFDELLAAMIADFIKLTDSDLTVRHVSLSTLNSAAHNKPYLIRGILTELLPSLYNETVVKEELIHIVEMGPFKHRVDDGLEARKAAFECMYTLLEKCLSRIEISAFLDRVIVGLADAAQDIKVLNHLILQRLAVLAPTTLVARLDATVGPLQESVKAVPKANAVKQDIEKVNELVRSAVRAVVVLWRAMGATNGGGERTGAPLFEEMWKGMKTSVGDVVNSITAELDAQAQQSGRASRFGAGPMDLS